MGSAVRVYHAIQFRLMVGIHAGHFVPIDIGDNGMINAPYGYPPATIKFRDVLQYTHDKQTKKYFMPYIGKFIKKKYKYTFQNELLKPKTSKFKPCLDCFKRLFFNLVKKKHYVKLSEN